jgi:hypothetical protein
MDKEQPLSSFVPIPLAKWFGQNAFALVKFIHCGGFFRALESHCFSFLHNR